MTRLRQTVGLIVGLLLLLSGVAHTTLGWKEIGSKLTLVLVPSELQFAVQAGWIFGGVAMLAFGSIVCREFIGRLRLQAVSPMPVWNIGAMYLAFGAWALITSGFDLFFMLFAIPGALLLWAAPGGVVTMQRDSAGDS